MLKSKTCTFSVTENLSQPPHLFLLVFAVCLTGFMVNKNLCLLSHGCRFGSLSGQASFNFIFPQSLIADSLMSSTDIKNSRSNTYKPDLFVSIKTMQIFISVIEIPHQ